MVGAAHNTLYERAVSAIQDLFSDQSVPREETRSSLQGLREEIAVMVESLEVDETD